MSTATVPDPVQVVPHSDDQLHHFYCDCTPDRSLCGLDVSGDAFCPAWCDCLMDCVVCDEIDQAGVCPFNCGIGYEG